MLHVYVCVCVCIDVSTHSGFNDSAICLNTLKLSNISHRLKKFRKNLSLLPNL